LALEAKADCTSWCWRSRDLCPGGLKPGSELPGGCPD
jgi:hypothetical protein